MLKLHEKNMYCILNRNPIYIFMPSAKGRFSFPRIICKFPEITKNAVQIWIKCTYHDVPMPNIYWGYNGIAKICILRTIFYPLKIHTVFIKNIKLKNKGKISIGLLLLHYVVSNIAYYYYYLFFLTKNFSSIFRWVNGYVRQFFTFNL